jgi:hypothetical protein
MKMRSGMSQSLTEHLDSEAGASPRYQFRKSRSMKLAVKDEVEGDWSKFKTLCFHWSNLKFKFCISHLIG